MFRETFKEDILKHYEFSGLRVSRLRQLVKAVYLILTM